MITDLRNTIKKFLVEDNHYEGKALRLKQHYFFVSATIQHIVKSLKKNSSIRELPDKVAIHINDTHPALAIPELMRVLIDEEGMEWDEAWDITTRTIAYTNHTILSEALERWPLSLFKELLPRLYMITSEINERFCRQLWDSCPGQWEKISRMAIIAYNEVRMANLCIVGSHSINGVSALHTDILKRKVFNEFCDLTPYKFCNITNGITHRRWLLHANPKLAQLVSNTIGDGWILNPSELKKLESSCEDSSFQDEFSNIRKSNKQVLSKYILDNNNISIDPDSIFDVQVKRLHEYKRQLLNIFRVMYLYNRLIESPTFDMHPRTFIFGAKASPGYSRAKLIIKLINSVAEKVNNDNRINNKLKVVFLENYGVSLAEKIIPAADVSEQISTAGKEASGTSNMKLMLNGALTVGTLDGANVEIRDAVGPDNIYIFGLKSEQVSAFHQYGNYEPRTIYERNYALKELIDQLINGFYERENAALFSDLYHSLIFGNGEKPDNYMVLMDFESYIHVHEKIEREFKTPEIWWKKAIINTANAGIFSSDRSIQEYNSKVWNLQKYDSKRK